MLYEQHKQTVSPLVGDLNTCKSRGVSSTSMVCTAAYMPGVSDVYFLGTLQKAVERKCYQNDIYTAWIAPKSLYLLWRMTTYAAVELFADCTNESGLLDTYCSKDPADEVFGSSGLWESKELFTVNGAGNPPFDQELVRNMLGACELGVQRSTPYCRCLFLPIGSKYNTTQYLEQLTSEGVLLVTIPA